MQISAICRYAIHVKLSAPAAASSRYDRLVLDALMSSAHNSTMMSTARYAERM